MAFEYFICAIIKIIPVLLEELAQNRTIQVLPAAVYRRGTTDSRRCKLLWILDEYFQSVELYLVSALLFFLSFSYHLLYSTRLLQLKEKSTMNEEMQLKEEG